MNRSLLAFLALSLIGAAAQGASVTVSFDSGTKTFVDNLSAILLGGSNSVDGDGDVIQLGYFSNGTAGNNFNGTWIPLSGQGSANTGVISGSTETYNKTSIGDQSSQGAGNGTFALSLAFTVGDATTGNNLPSSTSIPLCIRVYNGTTVAGSTFFNTVSNNAWLWLTPVDSPSIATVSMSLDQAGAVWQGGASSALKTTIVNTPEPASAGLAIIGGLAVLLRRRRNS